MKISCPQCKKEKEWEGNPFRPFCSERCKVGDLANWADESYRVPGEKITIVTEGCEESGDEDF